MKKSGRPTEKVDAEKITLYLEGEALDALLRLSAVLRCSRSKVVEKLAVDAEKLLPPLSSSQKAGQAAARRLLKRVVSSVVSDKAMRKASAPARPIPQDPDNQ